MKHTRSIFKADAVVQFTQQDLKVLMDCAVSHYDPLCRRQVEHGGLVYQLGNAFSAEQMASGVMPAAVEMRYETADLDLLCKILEFRQANELAAYLHDELAGVLSFVNRCFSTTPVYP